MGKGRGGPFKSKLYLNSVVLECTSPHLGKGVNITTFSAKSLLSYIRYDDSYFRRRIP